MTDENAPTQELVEKWMAMTTAPVHYTKICDSQFDRQYWPHLRMICQRMVKKGLVEHDGSKDGIYRYCANLNQPIKVRGRLPSRDSGLILPFDLREWCFIGYDTVTVVAGSKSSGKTGFLLNTISLNMSRTDCRIKLLTNLEGGIDMLNDRMEALGVPTPEPFDVLPVNDNYHDYIRDTNTLYVIDYIDIPDGEKFYMAGHLIKKIAQKIVGLDSVAVVGIQKPIKRDVGLGGERTLDAAMLYIALNDGRLKIVDCKVPAQPAVHPKNMQFTFQYKDAGTNFTNIQPYYGDEPSEPVDNKKSANMWWTQ
jgi:hypothetical protein